MSEGVASWALILNSTVPVCACPRPFMYPPAQQDYIKAAIAYSRGCKELMAIRKVTCCCSRRISWEHQICRDPATHQICILRLWTYHLSYVPMWACLASASSCVRACVYKRDDLCICPKLHQQFHHSDMASLAGPVQCCSPHSSLQVHSLCVVADSICLAHAECWSSEIWILQPTLPLATAEKIQCIACKSLQFPSRGIPSNLHMPLHASGEMLYRKGSCCYAEQVLHP